VQLRGKFNGFALEAAKKLSEYMEINVSKYGPTLGLMEIISKTISSWEKSPRASRSSLTRTSSIPFLGWADANEAESKAEE